jgi:hypothetical protein
MRADNTAMPPEVINSHLRVDEKGVAWIEGRASKLSK